MALGALLVMGCGTEAGNQGSVVGLWEAPSGSSCTVAFDFRSDGTYSESLVCTLADGSLGIQVADGTFSTRAGTVTLMADEATCVGWSKLSAETYTISGTELTLSDSSGVTLLTHETSRSGTGTYGCFESTGAFTVSPLAPL